jgi:uncharacterized protein (TIGR02118 family)
MSLKWIYLAKRNPATDHAEFRKRWREHSQLASQFAATMGRHFTGVRQCAKVQRADLPAALQNPYDGVALLSLRSMQDMREVWSDPGTLGTMIPDEPRVFSTQVMKFSLFATEWVEFDRSEGSFALLSFIRRKAGSDRAAFSARWRDGHAPLLLQVPAADRLVRSYRQNHLFIDPPPGYDFDGVAELWFDSVEDALTLLADPAYRERIDGDLAAFTEPAAAVTLLIEINHRKTDPGAAVAGPLTLSR